MLTFAQAGDFCPNEACFDYGKLQSEQAIKNIKKFGKTKAGRLRHLLVGKCIRGQFFSAIASLVEIKFAS